MFSLRNGRYFTNEREICRWLEFNSLLPYYEKTSTPKRGACFLEQGTGIEPASVAWEATILPMN